MGKKTASSKMQVVWCMQRELYELQDRGFPVLTGLWSHCLLLKQKKMQHLKWTRIEGEMCVLCRIP